MLKKRKKANRLALIAACGLVLAGAVALTTIALQEQIVFFKTPADLKTSPPNPGERVRVGGLVQSGSWQRQGTTHHFSVADDTAQIDIRFTGIVPDLFRECQGVVLTGLYNSAGFVEAEEVLAKHDENYVPKELADTAMEKAAATCEAATNSEKSKYE